MMPLTFRRFFVSLFCLAVIANASYAQIGEGAPGSFPADFPELYDTGDSGEGHILGGFGGDTTADREGNRAALKKTPVVLVHGNGTHAQHEDWAWIEFRDFLKANGYNDSEIWAVSYLGIPSGPVLVDTHKDNINDVRRFIDAVREYLGVQKVDLVGHSLGCGMIRAYMLGYQEDGTFDNEQNRLDAIGTLVTLVGGNYGLDMLQPGEEFRPGSYFETNSHVFNGITDNTPRGSSNVEEQRVEGCFRSGYDHRGVTELDDDNITYVALWALNDFVDEKQPETGRLQGAHLNKCYELGPGLEGHQAILHSEEVFLDIHQHLNRIPPEPDIPVTAITPQGGEFASSDFAAGIAVTLAASNNPSAILYRIKPTEGEWTEWEQYLDGLSIDRPSSIEARAFNEVGEGPVASALFIEICYEEAEASAWGHYFAGRISIGEFIDYINKYGWGNRFTLYRSLDTEEWSDAKPVCQPPPDGQPASVRVINMVPATLSGEAEQDSEPFLAVDASNSDHMVGSAFTPNPNDDEGPAPLYVTKDGGENWLLNANVPSDRMTHDITLASGKGPKRLHAAILKVPGDLLMNVLRTDDFFDSTPMTVQANRADIDQPFVQADSSAGRVYVGNNDFSAPEEGKTASVEVSTDGGTTFTTVRLEPRETLGQDGPSIRPAIARDGAVYVAYFGWRTATPTGLSSWMVTSDVVVVRDRNGATGQTPFRDLLDADDDLPGVRVVKGVKIPFSNKQTLGAERIGSNLSLAVEPTNSDIVYIGWADRVGDGDIYTIHVRRSTDGGNTWSSDLRTVRDASPFALAVAENGTLGFLYQQYTGGRWVTHLEQTSDGFETLSDTVLANVPGDQPPFRGMLPYLGDYNFVMAVGDEFRGVFSTGNLPDMANFPNDVQYQREANFTTGRLLDADGNDVDVSIDPFYFSASVVP